RCFLSCQPVLIDLHTFPTRRSSDLAEAGGTFRSLRGRNFRLYFSGQLVSMAGSFMQAVAQSWLVLKLTGSGTALGLVTLLQFLRSEEHTSELQSRSDLVCRLLLEKK